MAPTWAIIFIGLSHSGPLFPWPNHPRARDQLGRTSILQSLAKLSKLDNPKSACFALPVPLWGNYNRGSCPQSLLAPAFWLTLVLLPVPLLHVRPCFLFLVICELKKKKKVSLPNDDFHVSVSPYLIKTNLGYPWNNIHLEDYQTMAWYIGRNHRMIKEISAFMRYSAEEAIINIVRIFLQDSWISLMDWFFKTIFPANTHFYPIMGYPWIPRP